MSILSNPLHLIDGYKTGHRVQYPKGTTLVHSNFTPRSSKLSNLPDDWDGKIVFFGLQYFLRCVLDFLFYEQFFFKKKEDVVSRYKRRMDYYLGRNAVAVDHIEHLHDAQHLPISIKALPEGSVVKNGVPVLTIENTHPDFYWLTNYLETILSNLLWKACTSATTARYYRMLLESYAEKTGGQKSFVPFQAHDFSFRGMSGIDDAIMSGMAHLTSFVGTDTLIAIDVLEGIYGADVTKELVGCSVPATEHSVMCMGGMETEIDTFKRLITEVYPKGIVSVVSDTWDFWDLLTQKLPSIKDTIMAREGKLVIRPDSGDPVSIICGDLTAQTGTPEAKGAVQCLWDAFGGITNDKGYRQLDEHIGLIYGDSITPQRAKEIVHRLYLNGFTSTNVVFGVGSFTYEYVTRDTHGWAVKSTYGEINGEPRDIFKSPKTDSGSKKSAVGRVCVVMEDGEYVLKDRQPKDAPNDLVEVYRDGEIKVKHKLSDIRARIEKTI